MNKKVKQDHALFDWYTTSMLKLRAKARAMSGMPAAVALAAKTSADIRIHNIMLHLYLNHHRALQKWITTQDAELVAVYEHVATTALRPAHDQHDNQDSPPLPLFPAKG